MSIPTNLTPETATVIGTLPFTATLDVTDAPTGTGYAATCASAQYHAVWYRYTTRTNETAIAVSADVTATGAYAPRASLWTGTPPLLDQYEIDAQAFCHSGVGGLWMNVPVTANTTYYFQIADANNTSPLGASLQFSVRGMPLVLAPSGALVITDDTIGFAGVILSPIDGSVLQVRPEFPATEIGDVLTSGIFGMSNHAQNGVVLLDAQLGSIATVSLPGESIVAVKAASMDAAFYVVSYTGSSGSPHTVRRVRVSDGMVTDTWTLPADSADAIRAAVTTDGATIYYASNTVNTAIHAYDLAGSAALPDLHAGFTGEQLKCNADGFVTPTGDVVFGYTLPSSPFTITFRRFSAAGAVLHTYTGFDFTTLNHFAPDPDGLSFWIWWNTDTGSPAFHDTATFQRVRISDGAILVTTPPVPVSTASGVSQIDGAVWNISDSCPLMILGTYGPPSPPPPAIPDPPTTGLVPPTLGNTAGTTRYTRRVRRFPLAFNENLWVFVSRLEILIQSGVGLSTGQGSDPILMLRLSRDGGATWGTELQMGMGKIGEYDFRAYVNRLGRGRNWWAEVSCSDPVFSVLLAAFVTVEAGTS